MSPSTPSAAQPVSATLPGMGAQAAARGRSVLTSGRRWTAEEVRALGVRTDVATAGDVLGVARARAYRLAREGRFPVPVVQVGERFVVPVAPLLRLLALEDDAT